MANRIVRDGILDSDLVNKLSWASEVFYRRIMSVADDFGRGDGRLSILRSKLYPLRLEKVSEADIDKWMDECSEAGLISRYEVSKKPYFEILNFNQSLRIKKSRYPENPCEQMQSSEIKQEPETKRIEKETVIEKNPEKQNLIDFFFNDLPNSQSFEKACIRASINKDHILKTVPDFKKAASVSYRNMDEFINHFKNWYLKVYLPQQKETTAKKRNTI